MRVAITMVIIVLVTVLYWMCWWIWQGDLSGPMIGQFLCHLIIVCTSVILKKLDSLKSKDKEKDSEEK